ncbi:hypothetical protein GTQ40_05000 [Flavobacteriaceae bacterium R38]|nr:hypothetical protein [Flavobacteriaceae bacterium R38]
MNQNDFKRELESLKAYRETRSRLADEVLADPSLYPTLLSICFEFDNDVSSRACWILEFVSYKKLEWLLPHISEFSLNLPKFKKDSAIRPIAKIIQLLCIASIKKGTPLIKDNLSDNVLERFAEANFDWLISNQKVAVKAYAMRSLFLLGKQFDWIYPELKLTLEKDYAKHSAAYKAAARDILKQIEKSA